MELRNLITKSLIINLLIFPKEAWKKIEKRNFKIPELYLRYVIFFALLPVLAHLLGFTVLRDLFIPVEQLELMKNDPQAQEQYQYLLALLNMLNDGNFSKEILVLIVIYISELFSPILLGAIIFFLSPAFEGIKDPDKSFTVAVFSLIPMWIGKLFYVFNNPVGMTIVFGASFYTFYLVYVAGEKFLKLGSNSSRKEQKQDPQIKSFQFIIVVVILYLIISAIVGMITSKIIYKIAIS